jgi:hypothetical protein
LHSVAPGKIAQSGGIIPRLLFHKCNERRLTVQQHIGLTKRGEPHQLCDTPAEGFGNGLNVAGCGFDLFFHLVLRVKTRDWKGSSLIAAKNHQGSYPITGDFLFCPRLRPGDKSVLWRSLLLDLRLIRLSSDSDALQDIF